MAADGINVKVQGLPDLRAALASIPIKLRRRALRNALAAGARVVQKMARQVAPRLTKPSRYRTAGLVQKAISVRTSKLATRRGNVGVFVNVRPAKKGQRGAKSRTDPFYWRWLEFGWNPAGRGTGGWRGSAGKRARARLNKTADPKIRSGWGFLQAGGKMLGQALEVFKAKIGPQIAKLNGGKGVQL